MGGEGTNQEEAAKAGRAGKVGWSDSMEEGKEGERRQGAGERLWEGGIMSGFAGGWMDER